MLCYSHVTPLHNNIGHSIQQNSTMSYIKSHLSIMKHVPILSLTLQLLNIGATIDTRLSNTNKQLTIVKAMVIAEQ